MLTDLYVVCVTTQNVLSRDPVPRRSKAARPKNGFSTLYFTSGSPQAPQNDNRISRDVFHFKRCQQLGPTFFCTLPQDHTDLRLNFDLYICISAKLSRCRASIALHHNAIVSPQESPSEADTPRAKGFSIVISFGPAPKRARTTIGSHATRSTSRHINSPP